jgi:hypothetical protein
MRAAEFITEDTVHNGFTPRLSAHHAMPGAHRVGGTADRLYDLNRIMMYVASSDGDNEVDLDYESWAGKNTLAFPYTEHELKMLKKAYKHLGIRWDDVLHPNPDNQSQEVPGKIQTQSPVKGFKGYPR